MKTSKAFVFNGIAVYRQKIVDSVQIVEAIENALEHSSRIGSWERAKVVNSDGSITNEETRTNDGLFLPAATSISDDPHQAALIEIAKILAFNYAECLTDYLSRFQGIVDTKVEQVGLHFLKYELGEQFTAHIDDGPNSPRRVSGLAYLNDDYDGGELYFPKFNLTYSPVAGDIVIFPSGIPYEHSALPIKSGVKYCVATWWY